MENLIDKAELSLNSGQKEGAENPGVGLVEGATKAYLVHSSTIRKRLNSLKKKS